MKYTLLLLVFFTFIFSCKKEKNEEPVVSAPPAQTDTTATDSIPADTLVVMSDSCYGEFMFGRQCILLPNNSIQPGMEYPMAVFQISPCLYKDMPVSGIGIDSITCNGVDISYNGYTYQPGFSSIFAFPLYWHIKGDSLIQGFDYATSGTFPFFGGYLSMPDTINSHQPFQMTLTGLTGQSYVIVLLYDAAGNSTQKVYQTDSSQVTISFSPGELSQLVHTPLQEWFKVTLKKHNLQTFHGKQFNFSTFMSVATKFDLH